MGIPAYARATRSPVLTQYTEIGDRQPARRAHVQLGRVGAALYGAPRVLWHVRYQCMVRSDSPVSRYSAM
eukprot:1006544-Rhodomonas_salina.1